MNQLSRDVCLMAKGIKCPHIQVLFQEPSTTRISWKGLPQAVTMQLIMVFQTKPK